MRDSIFWSSIRAFFVTIFILIGLGVGLVLVVLMLSGTSTTSITEFDKNYKQEVVANANGERKSVSSSAPVILKLNIHGVMGLENLTTAKIRRQLMESREGDLKDNRVKAVLLHINSPGGTVTDADGIYHAIKEYKEQYNVPVIAYIEGICASGGVYVACSADKIYSSDISMIGSVGVISPPFLNFYELMQKFGVKALTIYEGKGKDDLNPTRPWEKDEGDNIRALIQFYYAKFVDIVSSNRPKLTKEILINDLGAKVFNPIEAAEYGFTDGGMTYRDTLKLLLKQLKIEDETYEVVEMKKDNWVMQLFDAKSSLFTGELVHKVQLMPELDAKLMNQYLYIYLPNTN